MDFCRLHSPRDHDHFRSNFSRFVTHYEFVARNVSMYIPIACKNLSKLFTHLLHTS